MKHTVILWITAILLLAGTANAQDVPTKSEMDMKMLMRVLDQSGWTIKKYDFSAYQGKMRTIIPVMDEYVNGEKVEKEDAQYIIKSKEEGDFSEVAISTSQINDSTIKVGLIIGKLAGINYKLMLRKLNETVGYQYACKDFKLAPIERKDGLYVPLIVYSSFWKEGEEPLSELLRKRIGIGYVKRIFQALATLLRHRLNLKIIASPAL